MVALSFIRLLRVWLLTMILFWDGISTARAQVDLSGTWGQQIHEDYEQRIVGPAIGDFTGLPINEAARRRAQGWDDEHWSVPEHQCEAVPADYAPHGPASMRIWSEVNPKTQQLIAWHAVYLWQTPHRVIWMDGRRHPPAGVPHTWMGFSTGKWVGDTMVVSTTHLKEGWLRRNGVPRSDQASLTEYWMRHGNHLTVLSVVDDPVYLTAPFLRTSTWTLMPGYRIGAYSCAARAENNLPKGFVAHRAIPDSAARQEFLTRYRLPAPAAMGGEHTMYPEYARAITLRRESSSKEEIESAPSVMGRDRSIGEIAPARPFPASEGRGDITVLPVRENIFVLMSSEGNTTVQVGSDGVLIVDTQPAELTAVILDEVRKLSREPIRHILNTSASRNSTGGNAAIARVGRTIGPASAFFDIEAGVASIYAHEKVLLAMSRASSSAISASTDAWPTDVYFMDSMDLHLNGEAVRLLHMPAAYSGGDSVVHFRRADVISTGDVFVISGYPQFDIGQGGSINGVINALNRIIDVTVPERSQEGGTLVVPGRGRLCDEYEVVAYRDMVTIVRDRIVRMIDDGWTLEQVQAAQPTRDYDGKYTRDRTGWTPARFVKEAYDSLKASGDY